MTWTRWLALVASQLVVGWVAVFILFRDLPRSLFGYEKLICAAIGLGLIGVDLAVLLGYVGPGWPVPVRSSLAVFAAAIAAWSLNDAVYLATKRVDPEELLGFSSDIQVDRTRFKLRVIGFTLAVSAALWLMSLG